MKKLFAFLPITVLLICTVSSTLFFACKKANTDTISEVVSNASIQTDQQGQTAGRPQEEQIFRGVMLLQGSLPSEIPSLVDSWEALNAKPDSVKLAMTAFADLICDSIQNRDTTFFLGFNAVMIAGDPYSMEAKLQETALLFKQIITNTPQYSEVVSVVEDAVSSVDQTVYDLTTSEGVEDYMNEVQSKAIDDLQDLESSADVAIPIFVVAAAIWEAVAAVNVAVFLTAVGLLFAEVKIYESAKFRDPIMREQLCNEIYTAVN